MNDLKEFVRLLDEEGALRAEFQEKLAEITAERQQVFRNLPSKAAKREAFQMRMVAFRKWGEAKRELSTEDGSWFGEGESYTDGSDAYVTEVTLDAPFEPKMGNTEHWREEGEGVIRFSSTPYTTKPVFFDLSFTEHVPGLNHPLTDHSDE